MPYFPIVSDTEQKQIVTNTFLGYNRAVKIGEGSNNVKPLSSLEFHDMENLTSSHYPLMASREPRGVVKTLTKPTGVLGKSKLAYIDGSSLYYGGADVSSYLSAKGCIISQSDSMLPKQLISMGAYIVIYPDKLYFNTENYTDCGRIEAQFTTGSTASITYTQCAVDGTDYSITYVGATEPSNPLHNEMWIDTSDDTKHILKQYSANSSAWVEVPTVYCKIETTGIGASFEQYDGVTISGCSAATTAVEEQIDALNGSKVIYEKGDNYIVVVGLIDMLYVQNTGTVTISRTMPDLDYITEAENRLWGCKYGLTDGKTVNEIYCCALGDFKNWNRFLGLSTDSYVASVGTDGKWTGAATHLGYPIFFKENVLHKVYISATGAHRIVDTACRGVQEGCHNSLAVVNEKLLYKSRSGIVAYDGSLPSSASECFGEERYSDASAGVLDNKYYVSMKDSGGTWHMFVLDMAKGLWHREDNTHALAFSRCRDELFYLDADSKKLIAVTGTEGTLETDMHWFAETGLMGYNTIEQKYISRFNIRMVLPRGSCADIFLEYDSNGVWEHCGHLFGFGTKTFMLPVRPKRCDHFRLRIEGKGEIKVYSIAKILEVGSDF